MWCVGGCRNLYVSSLQPSYRYAMILVRPYMITEHESRLLNVNSLRWLTYSKHVSVGSKPPHGGKSMDKTPKSHYWILKFFMSDIKVYAKPDKKILFYPPTANITLCMGLESKKNHGCLETENAKKWRNMCNFKLLSWPTAYYNFDIFCS